MNCKRAGTYEISHCKNFIKHLNICDEKDQIIFCGTNAFNPKLYSIGLSELSSNSSQLQTSNGKNCPSSPLTSRKSFGKF